MAGALQDCIDALDHHRAGRPAEAEACYRAALAAEPDFTPLRRRALHCMALLLMEAGRAGEAASCWRDIVAAAPRDLPAIVNLANALCRDGQVAASIGACDAALAIDGQCVEAFLTRGRALIAGGRVDEAVAHGRMAVSLLPGNAAAQAALAIALLHAKDPAGAVLAADLAVALDPGLVDGWFARGTASAALRSWKAAMAALEHAVRLSPGHAPAQLNLGNAMLDLDRRGEAELWLRRAVALDPRLAEAHASLGSLLSGDGRLAEAVGCCETAIRLRPGFAEAHWNLGFAHLLAGDYGPGWREYEWRRRHPDFADQFAPLPGPEWRGEDVRGRTVLVRAEQGLGDTIQFARFLPLLAAAGADVVLACDAAVMTLLAPLARVVDRTLPHPAYHAWVELMSLPGLLGVTASAIPAARGYLRAAPVQRRPRVSMPSVGVVWSGNPAHSNDRRRSMPVDALAPVLELPGILFTSLQVGPRGHDIAARFGLRDWSGELPDFAATARVVAELDLVVAVDTSVAHLAGAMGKATILMLPFAPDWRWMAGRSDTPWYSSVTIVRQTAPGDWQGVAAAVAREIARRHGRRAAAGLAAAPRPAPRPEPSPCAGRGSSERGPPDRGPSERGPPWAENSASPAAR